MHEPLTLGARFAKALCAFEPDDHICALEQLECDDFADRERVGYRLKVSNAEGVFLVEQQAYLSECAGQIGWMRVLCSGFRPTTAVVSQTQTP